MWTNSIGFGFPMIFHDFLQDFQIQTNTADTCSASVDCAAARRALPNGQDATPGWKMLAAWHLGNCLRYVELLLLLCECLHLLQFPRNDVLDGDCQRHAPSAARHSPLRKIRHPEYCNTDTTKHLHTTPR